MKFTPASRHFTTPTTGRRRFWAVSDPIYKFLPSRCGIFSSDPSADVGSARSEIRRLQESTTASLDKLQPLTRPQDAVEYGRMRGEVDDYWRSLDPLFTWSPAQRGGELESFLRSKVLPKRQAALDLAREIEELTASGIRQRGDEIERRQANLAWLRGACDWSHHCGGHAHRPA